MASNEPADTGYAPVNGLEMYYEIHGENTSEAPILLLHGAFHSTGHWGQLLPGLAATRQVIAPDFQTHGRTANIERLLSYELLAEDSAALLTHLGVNQADVVGISTGGAVGIQLAIRHPELVRALVPISAAFRIDGAQPALLDAPDASVEDFTGSPIATIYAEVAPRPEDFGVLVEQINRLDKQQFNWDADAGAISAPTLIIIGDADVTLPEHGVEMLRLLGGGSMGDFAGIGKARLAILPGTTHYMPYGQGVLDRHAWLVPMITDFLDAPDPVPGMGPEQ